MSTTSADLTAIGVTAEVSIKPGRSLQYESAGVFTGSLKFQRSRTGGLTWEAVEAPADDTNVSGGNVKNTTTADERYRFQMLGTVTGTCSVQMTENDDVIAELFAGGKLYARVKASGIEFVGDATAGAAA